MLVKGERIPNADFHKQILLMQLGDIGDVVVCLPIFKAFRENFPESKIVVCVREKARELIEDCPWKDDLISVDKRRRRFVEGIRYQKDF